MALCFFGVPLLQRQHCSPIPLSVRCALNTEVAQEAAFAIALGPWWSIKESSETLTDIMALTQTRNVTCGTKGFRL